MTILKNEDIEKIAHLAQLAIDKNTITAHVDNLSKILTLIDQINTVDTTGIPPFHHPFDESQPLRDDQITEHNQRELLQSIAPLVEKGLYLVPKVK